MEDDSLRQQLSSTVNNTTAAYVPARSVTPLLPVNRNVTPVDALFHSPSMAVQVSRFSTPQPRGIQRLSSRMEHSSMQLPLQTPQLQRPLLTQQKINDSIDNDAPFKVKVLRLLTQNLEKTTQVDVKVNMLIEKVQNILSQSVPGNDHSAIVDISVLPLKTREDLITYEQLLTTDADQYFKLVSIFLMYFIIFLRF